MREQSNADRLLARGCTARDLELARKSELISLALHAGDKRKAEREGFKRA